MQGGEGVGLFHIRSVERSIAEGRLKVLPLSGEIWVGVSALLRADAPEHPMVEKLISLVTKAFVAWHHRAPASISAKQN
jgi:DNA-binding transcriptional LysR family regulator